MATLEDGLSLTLYQELAQINSHLIDLHGTHCSLFCLQIIRSWSEKLEFAVS